MKSPGYVQVIMPVASDPMFSKTRIAIDVAIKQTGLEAKFPDHLLDEPSFILPELIKEIIGANSIIVDVSHERPSCYYELGIAEALGKIVHLIAEVGTSIHQCAARRQVRFYFDMDDLTRTVEIALQESRKATLKQLDQIS
jgi:hypothetical protein